MTKYEVGKPFPHKKYLNSGEITVAMLHEAFFDVVCILGNVTSNEKKDWKKGSLTVNLYEQSNVPFIAFSFDKWSFGVNINIGKIDDDKINGWLNSDSNIINLFLVEATTKNLEAFRIISIPTKMADKIRDICEVQSEMDVGEIDTHIQAVLAGVSTAVMINNAELKYKIK